MTETIYILDEFVDLEKIDFKKIDNKSTIFFSLDNIIHNKLERKKINHKIGESFLDEKSRDRIFEKVIQWHNWYDDFKPNFDFNGVNVLSMLDTNEFHTYVIHKLIQFQTIKNILNVENPKKIFTSSSLYSMLTSLSNLQIFNLTSMTEKEKLAWDELNIILKIGPLPLPIKISRKMYQQLKNRFEKIICNFFNLWFNPKPNSKVILFLEFNPSDYEGLLRNLKNYDVSPVFLNFRRSAMWNLSSIRSLRKNGGKIINTQKFLDSNTKKSLNKIHREFLEKFNKFWKNEEIISKKFIFEGISFWPSIKDMLIQTYDTRLYEYLTLLTLSKSFFTFLNIHCVVTLNEVGETEKAILNVSNNKKPSILLEHGFANYIPELTKFDSLSYYHLLRDKIAVWGKFQKDYLHNIKNISEDRIIVVGSPKHDHFFSIENTKSSITNKKTILLTTHPIIDLVGRGGTIGYNKFEIFLKNLVNAKKTFSNVELVVKLHPSPDSQHEYTKNFLLNLDPTIKVFQTTPILDLIKNSDAMINVSEFYSPSTAMMESMILSKPVGFVSIHEKKYSFDFIKNNAVLSIDEHGELSKLLHDLLYDEIKRKELIENAHNFLNDYLHNPGTASQKFAKILASDYL